MLGKYACFSEEKITQTVVSCGSCVSPQKCTAVLTPTLALVSAVLFLELMANFDETRETTGEYIMFLFLLTRILNCVRRKQNAI